MYKSLFSLFGKYVSIGVINTAIHWLVFFLMLYGATLNQAYSNFIAFMVAVTFSFFANARFTFKAAASKQRYMFFVSFMAILSFATGFFADKFSLQPIITLIVFSLISLVLGFLYSRFVVFRER